jgi:hypothetical protein
LNPVRFITPHRPTRRMPSQAFPLQERAAEPCFTCRERALRPHKSLVISLSDI